LPKLDPFDINPGDELYVGDSWSIDHGETDMDGGIAVVKGFSKWGDNSRYFVVFEGLGHSPNLAWVLEHQDEWEKEFSDRLAHDCPDGTKCPNPRRECDKCGGRGFLCNPIGEGLCTCKTCEGTGKGKIKRSPMAEALKRIRSKAFRSKLLRASRREI
jgi:hypothetical protein